MADPDDFSGQVIKGLELRERIGQGGFGVVYRAFQPMLERHVAVKIIYSHFVNQPDFIRRFEAEAHLIARLEHPHIIPLYDYWRDAGGAYLVMRWVRQGSLAQKLQAGPLTLARAARLLDQVGAALIVAHRAGIVHGDVKPSNILVDEEQNAYLADFGIAQESAAPGLNPETSRLHPAGALWSSLAHSTPAYLLPEQEHLTVLTPQVDIYTLGMVLYEALAGRPADGAQPMNTPRVPLHELRTDVPKALDAVLQRALAPDPAARYADVMSLVLDVRQALAQGAEWMPETLVQPMPLPSGMVTFLFTDIENSTALWEHYPDSMATALAQHNALLRDMIERHAGYVFQVVGDAFCAVFVSASEAIMAALDAQRALQKVHWGLPGPLRVRMALHSGVTEARGFDYLGKPLLNRVARFMTAAHGEQVLVSQATADLALEHLPEGVHLRDMGAHQFKGLIHAESLYQVVADGLREHFPPLLTSGAVRQQVPVTLMPDNTNPYKGLRAFEEADARDFHGREALLKRLLARCVDDSPFARFLAVVGPSGSGKSSLVHAGLLPALRRGAIVGAARWFYIEMTPGANPLAKLAAALLGVAVVPLDVLAALQQAPRTLPEIAAQVLPEGADSELVLVVDQFEETFTLVTDERERADFLAALYAAVCATQPRIRVVITLRADFYDRPLHHPEWGALLRERTEVVLPLGPEELERAIVRPAERHGLAVAPELVSALIADVNEQPGGLPLLQYALTELFEGRMASVLTLVDYRASGGISGALARRAEEVYAAYSAERQVAVRKIFLHLVALGEEGVAARRRTLRAELAELGLSAEALDEVLDDFGRHRLLTFDRERATRAPTVEIAHEALLKSWARLHTWLDAARVDLRVRQNLRVAAGEWFAAGQDPSFLATGARLSNFEGLTASGQVALTRDEQTYLQASAAARGAQQAEAQVRQAQELAKARMHALQLRRRALWLGAALILVLSVGVVAGFFALRAQASEHEARRAASITRARQVGADAINSLAADPERSILLALYALRVTREFEPGALPETVNALRRALQTSRIERTLMVHDASITAVVYSPDGTRLATADEHGHIYVWDVAQGAVLFTLPGHVDGVSGMSFSPDGGRLAAAYTDGVAEIWRLQAETGYVVVTVLGHGAWINRIAFTPDGAYVVTGSDDYTARIWEAATGKFVAMLDDGGPTGNEEVPDPAEIVSVAVSGDGQLVATGSANSLIKIWKIKRNAHGKLVGAENIITLKEHESIVFNLAFSPVMQMRPEAAYVLASADADGTARVWAIWPPGKQTTRWRTQYIFRVYDHASGVMNVAFSADGAYLATAGDDALVRMWEARTGRALFVLAGHVGAVQAVAFNADGTQLATGSNDRTVKLWDLRLSHEWLSFRAHEERAAYAAVFDATGTRLATSSLDGTAKIWAITPAYGGQAAGVRQVLTLTEHNAPVFAVVFSRDGTRVATAGQDQTARIWNAVTGELLVTLTGHTSSVSAVAFSPDGQRVATAGQDNLVKIWNSATGEVVLTLTGHDSEVWDVAYSPDGTHLASAGWDGTAKVWDSRTGALLWTLRGHREQVNAVAFSPDGTRLVTAGKGDGTARVWDLATGETLYVLAGHSGPVQDVAFSPDGRYVATGSIDKTVKLWLVADDPGHAFIGATAGQQVMSLPGDSGVWAVAFDPSGLYLAAAGIDGVVRLYVLPLTDLTALARTRVTRQLTEAECQLYLYTACGR